MGVTRWDTFWHTIWWSVVTFTTIGYGDVSPSSHIGKFFGMLIMFAGYTWNIILGGVVASLLVMAGLKEVDELDAKRKNQRKKKKDQKQKNKKEKTQSKIKK